MDQRAPRPAESVRFFAVFSTNCAREAGARPPEILHDQTRLVSRLLEASMLWDASRTVATAAEALAGMPVPAGTCSSRPPRP